MLINATKARGAAIEGPARKLSGRRVAAQLGSMMLLGGALVSSPASAISLIKVIGPAPISVEEGTNGSVTFTITASDSFVQTDPLSLSVSVVNRGPDGQDYISISNANNNTCGFDAGIIDPTYGHINSGCTVTISYKSDPDFFDFENSDTGLNSIMVTASTTNGGGASGSGSGSADVTVRDVPEPATWAMLLVGLSLVGGAARLRQAGRTLPSD